MPDTRALFWRRTDVEGLERLELSVTADAIRALGSVISTQAPGLRVDHRWTLTPDWRTRRVQVETITPSGMAGVLVERDGERDRWHVDGRHRADLDGAVEPDLSVTPFCNTLAFKRMLGVGAESMTWDVVYIDGATCNVVRSAQRYDLLGCGKVRYTDLGVAKGFEADLSFDEEGLVMTYEHLFERITPAAG